MAPRHKGRPRKSLLDAAARARAGKNKIFIMEPTPPVGNNANVADCECTAWTGGVNHDWLSDSEDSDYLTEDESDAESSVDVDEVLVGLDVGGWRLMREVFQQRMHRSRSRSSAQGNTSRTGGFPRLWLPYLMLSQWFW